MTENTEKKKWDVRTYRNDNDLEAGLNRAWKQDMEPIYIMAMLGGYTVVYVNYKVGAK